MLTEEQRILQQTASELVAAKAPVSRLRQLRDSEFGFSEDLWREMAALGWTGIDLPEEMGGAGLGAAELGVVMEQLGRNLAPEPIFSSSVLGATALRLAGGEVAAEWLPKVAAGQARLALAHLERGARFDPVRVDTKASTSGDGIALHGEKRLALDAGAADAILVSAAEAGGTSLFLIPRDTAGLTLRAQRLVDGRCAADLSLDGALVPAANRLGSAGRADAILREVLSRGSALLASEMLGAATAAFEATLEYLKTREQFGVKIGSFQALKHRAADVYTEIELTRSAVQGALRALDEKSANAEQRCSLAKARASDTLLRAADEAVQMHGGIGMTDEHDIGFYLKRARVAEMTLGDAAWHRNRYAELAGY